MTSGWFLWFFCELPSRERIRSEENQKKKKELTTAIDHNASKRLLSLFFKLLFLDSFRRFTHMLRCKVRASGSTSENDMNILVTTRLDNSGKTLLSNTHESVRIGGGMHGVYGDIDAG